MLQAIRVNNYEALCNQPDLKMIDDVDICSKAKLLRVFSKRCNHSI